MLDLLLVILIFGSVLGLFVWLVVRYIRLLKRSATDLHTFITSKPKPAVPEVPGNAFVESKLGQRAGGLILSALGGYFIFKMWNEVLQGEGYPLAFAALFPVVAVLGLGLLCFPMDVAAQREKYGTREPRSWSETPPAMKVYIVLAVIAGIGNLVALYVITK